MLETLLSGPYAPFTFALALLFGLLALEIAALILGGTMMGDGAGAGDLDAELDLDFDLADLADMPEVGIGDLDLDPAEFELPALEDVATEAPAATGGGPLLLGWLGLGRMPTLLWLATLCLIVGLGGLIVQNAATALLGSPLPAIAAALPVAGAALWATGRVGMAFARLLPRTETQSVARRQLARRRGRVTQGTAARGRPAEVRVHDRYGNMHHLRAEPFRDDDRIPQGTEVLVLRHRATGTFRLIPLGD